MKGLRILTLLSAGLIAVSAFSGGDDKFIKKYAMMKIYESCFGQEVIQQIRDEMKIAVSKCAAMELEHQTEDTLVHESTPAPVPVTEPPAPSPHPPVMSEPEVPQPAPAAPQPHNLPFLPPFLPNTIPVNSQPMQDSKGLFTPEFNKLDNSIKSSFDPEKLHQAILAYRPNPFHPANLRPFNNPANAFLQSFAPQGAYAAPAPVNFYQGNPFGPVYPHYPPYYQTQYYSTSRLSRDLDLNKHVEDLKSRLNGKVRNVTCVMQELGYLDGNLEPTYDKIIAKINSLAIQDELKKDIEEGIEFCKQFSQCIPESQNDKSPLSSSLMKPMFFFRCYKHKKLEACIMKDVRDRFSGPAEDDLDALPEPELVRKGKSADLSKETSSEELTSTIFDFVFGNQNMDLDEVF